MNFVALKPIPDSFKTAITNRARETITELDYNKVIMHVGLRKMGVDTSDLPLTADIIENLDIEQLVDSLHIMRQSDMCIPEWEEAVIDKLLEIAENGELKTW